MDTHIERTIHKLVNQHLSSHDISAFHQFSQYSQAIQNNLFDLILYDLLLHVSSVFLTFIESSPNPFNYISTEDIVYSVWGDDDTLDIGEDVMWSAYMSLPQSLNYPSVKEQAFIDEQMIKTNNTRLSDEEFALRLYPRVSCHEFGSHLSLISDVYPDLNLKSILIMRNQLSQVFDASLLSSTATKLPPKTSLIPWYIVVLVEDLYYEYVDKGKAKMSEFLEFKRERMRMVHERRMDLKKHDEDGYIYVGDGWKQWIENSDADNNINNAINSNGMNNSADLEGQGQNNEKGWWGDFISSFFIFGDNRKEQEEENVNSNSSSSSQNDLLIPKIDKSTASVSIPFLQSEFFVESSFLKEQEEENVNSNSSSSSQNDLLIPKIDKSTASVSIPFLQSEFFVESSFLSSFLNHYFLEYSHIFHDLALPSLSDAHLIRNSMVVDGKLKYISYAEDPLYDDLTGDLFLDIESNTSEIGSSSSSSSSLNSVDDGLIVRIRSSEIVVRLELSNGRVIPYLIYASLRCPMLSSREKELRHIDPTNRDISSIPPNSCLLESIGILSEENTVQNDLLSNIFIQKTQKFIDKSDNLVYSGLPLAFIEGKTNAEDFQLEIENIKASNSQQKQEKKVNWLIRLWNWIINILFFWRTPPKSNSEGTSISESIDVLSYSVNESSKIEKLNHSEIALKDEGRFTVVMNDIMNLFYF
ncbi:hypothetical protein ADUPG1_007699 [Aduncisulcus paluster]|uniref:Rab3 GTPase-activating protein catalytic subunit n=1 Tax=Aduncisulcus paluster TaxID=2918883 RepID=A0ABQ5KTJ6_9EUKA|nr:hypothetical protein ADUPG1_007699 [Aduncisulcus paluster]